MSEFVFVPLFVLTVALAVLAVYNNIAIVKKFKLNTDKFNGSLRIALLSDFHNKSYGKGSARLIEKIRRQSPDVIFITGDTVDRRRPDFERAREFVEGVRGIADTYLVTGNHEQALGLDESVRKLECADVLVNDDYKIFADFSVLGLSDVTGRCEDNCQRDLVSIFEKLENFKIIAVHRPTPFYKDLVLRERDVDLVLCGHTHGGAVRIPFFGAILSPDEGLFPKYSKGMYKENGTTLIVSAGLGNTFLPLRVNNFPEIVVIDVTGTKK